MGIARDSMKGLPAVTLPSQQGIGHAFGLMGVRTFDRKESLNELDRLPNVGLVAKAEGN